MNCWSLAGTSGSRADIQKKRHASHHQDANQAFKAWAQIIKMIVLFIATNHTSQAVKKFFTLFFAR
jgi:hypothetical protein